MHHFLNLHYIVRKLLFDFTVVNCSDPGFMENSIRHGQQNFPESFKYGSSVIYHCKKGFYLLGSSTVTCKANGLWDRSLPKCLRKYPTTVSFFFIRRPEISLITMMHVSYSYSEFIV